MSFALAVLALGLAGGSPTGEVADAGVAAAAIDGGSPQALEPTRPRDLDGGGGPGAPPSAEPSPAPEPLQVIAVEAGARVTPMRRAFCKLVGDGRFSVTSDGQLNLDARGVGARAELLLGDCRHPTSAALVGVSRIAPIEQRTRPEADLEPDEGTVALHFSRLTDRTVWWRLGSQGLYSEASLEGIELSDGRETGRFPLAKEILRSALAGPSPSLEVLLLPLGMPLPAANQQVTLWDQRGVEIALGSLKVPITRVLLDRPPIQPAPLEAWRESTQLAVTWPGVVTQATCPARGCQLSDDHSLVVVTSPAEGDTLRLELTLRDGVALRTAKGLLDAAVVSLALARCRLEPLLPAVLAGVADHHVPLELVGNCPGELTDLAVETAPVTVAAVSSIVVQGDGQRRVDVTLAQSPRGPAVLRLQLRAGPRRVLVGSVTLPLSDAVLSTRTTLQDSEVGEVDVVPINRAVEARTLAQDFRVSSSLVVEPLPGFYRVLDEPGKPRRIQGISQSGGSIPLLVGYRPPAAQIAPDGPALAYFQSLPGYQVKEVSVPVALATDPEKPAAARLFQLVCHDGEGKERVLHQGEIVNLPQETRHTCRLIIDHGALRPTDGPQRVRITIGMSHPDTTPAPGSSSKVVTIRPRSGVETVWIEPGAPIREFDHMRVTLAHDDVAGFYLGSGEALTGAGITAASAEVVFGNSRFRLYGSAAVPTGLYRINGPLAGAIAFSAGALMRLAALGRSGSEFPIDAEFGIFGTGISQSQTNLSFVLGTGLTVPILNPGQPAQASVGIHAWLEYSPTVLNPNGPTNFGDRWAVIFGPSVSIGDFGANF